MIKPWEQLNIPTLMGLRFLGGAFQMALYKAILSEAPEVWQLVRVFEKETPDVKSSRIYPMSAYVSLPKTYMAHLSVPQTDKVKGDFTLYGYKIVHQLGGGTYINVDLLHDKEHWWVYTLYYVPNPTGLTLNK